MPCRRTHGLLPTRADNACFFRLQVIDLISLKPFDMETISKSVKKTRHAVIVEECMKTGGIGASLSAIISESLFDELDHQVRNGPGMEQSRVLHLFRLIPLTLCTA